MRCIVCNSAVEAYPLCNKCHPEILDFEMCCGLCGIYTGGIIKTCESCRDRSYENVSIFPYLGLPKTILNLYKFKNYKEFGVYYSEVVLSVINRYFPGYTIVPIPSSLRKRRKKGWYQLDPISKSLRANGIPVCNLLYKRAGKNQKKLNREERQENALNSFYIKKKKILGKILIFDDVYTTGATLSDAVMTLRKSGYPNIKTLTLYRD